MEKLSTELRKEKAEVERAKAEASREMMRSEKVDEETGHGSSRAYTHHCTDSEDTQLTMPCVRVHEQAFAEAD